jgi:hypothetical protein
MNSALYCEVLLKLRNATLRKPPGQLTRGYCFIIAMPALIQPEQPRREFKNYSGNFLNIHLTARFGPYYFHLFGPLKKVSLIMKRLKRRCGIG